jgi:hypothetical protein
MAKSNYSAWLGAKKKAVSDIAKWASAGIGGNMRKKYAEKKDAGCSVCGDGECCCPGGKKQTVYNK